MVKMVKKKVRCISCGLEKNIHAKGLCASCYQKKLREDAEEKGLCVTCRKRTAMEGHKVCEVCSKSATAWVKDNPDALSVKNRCSSKENYKHIQVPLEIEQHEKLRELSKVWNEPIIRIIRRAIDDYIARKT